MAFDSADTWARPELFQLDKDGRPTGVAGVPPDGFSATGQLWGQPPSMTGRYTGADGYSWWIQRLAACFERYDVVRIDHFRGFDEYFRVPAGAPDARDGQWMPGPGKELFDAVRKALGDRPVIAEDLGYLTDTVRQLVADCGFPGMKVMEFAFDARDSSGANEYLPHNYPENCVVYTGTHDNETVTGWFQTGIHRCRAGGGLPLSAPGSGCSGASVSGLCLHRHGLSGAVVHHPPAGSPGAGQPRPDQSTLDPGVQLALARGS